MQILKLGGIKNIKLVYCGLFLLIIKDFLYNSNMIPWPDILDDAISACIMAIFLMVMIQKKYSVKYLLIYFLVSVLAVYSAYITGYKIIAITVLTIFAIRDEPIDEIARFIFRWKSLLLLNHTLLALILAIAGIVQISGYFEVTRYRMHFGYGMPGHFADYVLDIMILWIWINYENIKNQDYIKLFFAALVCYICTDSRTVFAVSVLLIGGVFLTKKTRKFDWSIQMISRWIVPLLTAFMFCVIRLFAEEAAFGYAIDSLLNTRVRLNGYRLEQYGVTLFGQNCPLIYNPIWSPVWKTGGGPFDNVYMWLSINMGIVWLILISGCFYLLANKKKPIINLLIIIWALCSMLDTDFLNGIRSFSILLITLLFDQTKNENSLRSEVCNGEMTKRIAEGKC